MKSAVRFVHLADAHLVLEICLFSPSARCESMQANASQCKPMQANAASSDNLDNRRQLAGN